MDASSADCSPGETPTGSNVEPQAVLAEEMPEETPRASVTAESIAVPPRQYRFGLQALFLLVTLCCVQFSVMSYVGVLPALVISGLLCFLLLFALVTTAVILPLIGSGAPSARMEQLATRTTMALALLLLSMLFASGGWVLYEQFMQYRLAWTLESELGCTCSTELVISNQGPTRQVLKLESLNAGGLLHRAGAREGDVIDTLLTPPQFWQMLEDNRGSPIPLNLAAGATGNVLTPIENCPHREIVVTLPK